MTIGTLVLPNTKKYSLSEGFFIQLTEEYILYTFKSYISLTNVDLFNDHMNSRSYSSDNSLSDFWIFT